MTGHLSKPPVFRFAPSPNGPLHLGHALSAILNHDMARTSGGRLLLRLDDIDRTRCRPEFEGAVFEDMEWLGISHETPVRRQSDHLDLYRDGLDRLARMDLVYPSVLTRNAIRARIDAEEAGGRRWPRDPDGAPLYPGDERDLGAEDRKELMAPGRPHAMRLDMRRALSAVGEPLTWQETGDGDPRTVTADPAAWGDVILSRTDSPSSYHLSVVLDDAEQGVTHVVRGRDLLLATAVHRLLQRLLDLPEPVYHHHRLVLGPDGRKLSKSDGATGLRDLRLAGRSADDIRARIGLAAVGG